MAAFSQKAKPFACHAPHTARPIDDDRVDIRRPPAGYSSWTAPLLGRELVDIHEQHIWRFLRAQKIDLSGRKSWCQSTDPDFVSKAADIVGLYVALQSMPWCFRSTKSHRSRRRSGLRATLSYRMGGR
jgi:hypothetical protein